MAETEKIFTMPSQVISDQAGFNYLASIANSILDVEENKVIFDFTDCNHFEPNLCSILGSTFEERLEKGKSFFCRNVDRDMRSTLQNIGFLEGDVELHSLENSNQVTYTRFKIDDPDAIIQYVTEELLAKPGLPLISEDLKKEIARNILEIYINAVTHGECQYVYSCGYINRRSSKAELHFTLVDIGETIKKNVNNFLKENRSGAETIVWATSGFNTTKIGKSGGLGLKLMKQFLKNNDGKMQIISADGFYEFSKHKVNSLEMKNTFPGTIVNIIFNLQDTQFHYLDAEISPSVVEIF